MALITRCGQLTDTISEEIDVMFDRQIAKIIKQLNQILEHVAVLAGPRLVCWFSIILVRGLTADYSLETSNCPGWRFGIFCIRSV
jgi:hypothetical protein